VLIETLQCAVFFNQFKSCKMEQTAAAIMQCSVDENGVIQSSENFMEMEAMTRCG